MITSSEELKKLVERAKSADSVGIDTEFIWERTYYAKLGLIQLAISNDDCHLIDPTVIDDLSPLGELLESQQTIKILHDAPQDLAILKRATNSEPANIFDTKLVAGFCGLSSNLSLSNLLEEILEISLSKSETRTNWLKRPLDEKQIQYALDDVRYLRAARVVLLTRVYSPEVQSFLNEELTSFSANLSYQGLSDQNRYTKVKGAGGLSRKSLAILREITAWREKTARKKDRPRGHIVPDQVLISIAKNQSSKLPDFAICGLSANAQKKYGADLSASVEIGKDYPTDKLPLSLKLPRLSPNEKADLEKLSRMIKLKSDTKGIDHSIIANTSELKSYIKYLKNPDSKISLRQTKGWRAQFLDEFLI